MYFAFEYFFSFSASVPATDLTTTKQSGLTDVIATSDMPNFLEEYLVSGDIDDFEQKTVYGSHEGIITPSYFE